MYDWEVLTVEQDRPQILSVENEGARILRTNYWDTALARAGALFVSTNLRCFRLLVPAKLANQVLREVRGAREVVLTRGAIPSSGQPDALEILFEDHSQSPFSVHVMAQQCTSLPPPDESGRVDLRCIVYGPGLNVLYGMDVIDQLVRQLARQLKQLGPIFRRVEHPTSPLRLPADATLARLPTQLRPG